MQTAYVLDALYAASAKTRTYGASFAGTSPTYRVWAPTAKTVTLLTWAATAPGDAPLSTAKRTAMTRAADGSWSVTTGVKNARYLYEIVVYVRSTGNIETVQVTDPYSVALTTDSERSVVADLDDPALAPPGWRGLRQPRIAQPEDRTIYELHVRDFSVGDPTVPAAERGTYLAFTHPASAGMTHLRDLAEAGLNTVHLLPTFDIATIEERRADQQTPACDLASYAPDSTEQQACIEPVRPTDGFNWGYDPLHYTTPEGSYATDPDGAVRTLEYRRMVQGLNAAGLQVVMDVVFNHTAASGQDPHSVLDRVVPGYYQRLNATGGVESSTCCSNTATEHAMMEKLMIDSVLTWARDYKIQGFRFDLMGHHSLATMQRLRAALDRLTLRRDGIDGRGIYLYGEGWNFGEVADNRLFVQASQLNLGGSGIGSFSDRLRDAVRGGGPFDEDPRLQGFGSGLATDPNGAAVNGSPAEQEARLAHAEDLVKLGMAGNLADFTFLGTDGSTLTGRDVDYNGQPAGYAEDPSETVTYVDAHDNETLFDSQAYKLPADTSMADRARMNTVALSTVTLGQGVVFWHAGTDLMRSKSLDRNSFDSGDWFNRVDWTGQESTFGSGLPPRGDNEAKWDFMRPLLGDPALRPTPAAMADASAGAAALLQMRASSPLFRLGSASAIQDKVSFLPSDPGVVVMLVDDTAGADADPARDGILVVVNAGPDATSVPGVGDGWSLHPVQASGSDPVVRTAAVSGGAASVPARTTAVFVR